MVRALLGLIQDKKGTLVTETDRLLTDTGYIVIDTELTGLDENMDAIVSIGAVRMKGSRIELGDHFYRLVKPEAALKAESVVIHEITPSDVEGQPDIRTVLSSFLEFCGQDVLVGHCIPIDLGFINREKKRLFGSALRNPVLDTAVLYDYARTQIPSDCSFASPPMDYNRLYDIARCLDIPVSSAHNALMDAFITAQVFQRLIPMYMAAGIRNIDRLLKLQLKGGDQFRISGNM